MNEQLIPAVSSVGFPIVVTFYLLVRFQKSMDAFTAKVEELIAEIRKDRVK